MRVYTFDEFLRLEEHTCPLNILSFAQEVYALDGETDPHGIFEFVGLEADNDGL